MNAAIRKVGYALTLLILVIVGQLTYLQVIDADRLANDPNNIRRFLRDFNRPRGAILTADREIVAQSVPNEGEIKYQRVYPHGDLFAQISGYQSLLVGNTGVEASYNRYLTGRTARIRDTLRAAFSGEEATGNVVLAASLGAQHVARDALGGQRGSVVALDVRTGAVLAMYSNPSFDPNVLAGHDTEDVNIAYYLANVNPDRPLLPRAYRERYPPGSTFKVVTTVGALDQGIAAPETAFPTRSGFPLPQTSVSVGNFGGQSCGGTLVQSFIQSCNATFAQLGAELNEQFVPVMDGCGVRSDANASPPPLDLEPGAAASIGPGPGSPQARFALAGIGQGDVFTTPLEMALVTAGIANGGMIMAPHVVTEITDARGAVVDTIMPREWKRCATAETAAAVTDMMVQNVARGTGTGARIEGVTVAAKTGTAQNELGAPHAWFVAFAPAEDPRFAVAVLVEHGGNLGNDATGGRLAAPIARDVLAHLLGP